MENFLNLGGIFAIGGGNSFKVDWDTINIEAKKRIPLAFYHGGKDPVIPIVAATRTYDILKQKGLDHFTF
jgi:predicted esterase